jgi:hypothetical protein
MADHRVAETFEKLGLETQEKRDAFARFAQQGPLRIEPEHPADFRLDCMTLTNDDVTIANEDALAELA